MSFGRGGRGFGFKPNASTQQQFVGRRGGGGGGGAIDAVPSLMHMAFQQPQSHYRHQRHAPPPPPSNWLPPPIGWAAPPIGAAGAVAFAQHRQLPQQQPQQHHLHQQPGRHQPLQPPSVAGGRVDKSRGRRQQQQKQQLPAGGRVLPLMPGFRGAAAAQKRKSQPDQQQQSQAVAPAAAFTRPAAEVMSDAQRVLREACADVDRRDLPFQAVVATIRDRVPDFQFRHVFALVKDLHSDAVRGYYGNAADSKDAAESSSPLDDFAVLCDLFVCGVFAGVQGFGCNQLAAKIDSCRRLVDCLLDSPGRLALRDIQRPWQRGSNATPAVVAVSEADGAPIVSRHPPLLSLSTSATANRHRFEARARGLAQCLIKFYSTDRLAWEVACASQLDAEEGWDEPPHQYCAADNASLKSMLDSPALAIDPWATGSQPPHHRSDSPLDRSLVAPRQLSHLFVCHPSAHVSRPLPPAAEFRLTCHFNALKKVTGSTVGPPVPDARDRPSVSVQLHCNGALLSQADGASPEAARAAAAAAFVRQASQLQPVVRTQRTCSPSVPAVARDALVARGRELYEAEPARYNRMAQRLFQGGGPNPPLSRSVWSHMVARQPGLDDFLRQCLAYAVEFHAEPTVHCRVFGGDLEFAELCALYCALMSSGLSFQVDAVIEEWASPCHQRLLVHRTVDTAEIKRRLLTEGSFGRLELVSLGSRVDQVKADLGMATA